MGKTTHGKTYTKEYRTWVAMLSRCRNHNDCNYHNYGARGITVCERWHKFENFYEDMCPLPFYEAELDRIDNDKDYYKENCQWVTKKQNCRNRRSTKRYGTHVGILIQQELIEQTGLTKDQFRWYRQRYGIKWILENFKNDTLPKKVDRTIDRNDLAGKIFGKWKVLEFYSYTKKTGHLYLCKCECGRERIVQRSNLILGKSKQCHPCAYRKTHSP